MVDPTRAVRELLIAEAPLRGLDAEIISDGGAETLVLPGNRTFPLASLYGVAAEEEPGGYAELVSDWLDAVVAAASRAKPEEMAADELRERIRTRLVNSLLVGLEAYPYARHPFIGITQILCVDYPEALINLKGEMISRLALPLDELFVQGQINTDAEPTDEPVMLDDSGFAVLSGESSFIASKAAHLSALVPAVTGPAPHGLLFAIPRHNALVYAPVREGWADLVNTLAPFAAVRADQATEDGEMVSRMGYYWAPDGTVELLSEPYVNEDGGKSIRVVPGPVFTAQVMRQLPPA
ncbi:MAG: hypothetical protein LBJ02_11145 [Bifidobacteriaceae bacterium]|nr:hypothetical protein [Bifidobacteriaceae bacterium]